MKGVLTRFRKSKLFHDESEQPDEDQQRRSRDRPCSTGSSAASVTIGYHRIRSTISDLHPSTIDVLLREAQDYQLVHGGILKHVRFDQSPAVASAHMVGLSLGPSPFPRSLFVEACSLQVDFQALYMAVSSDPSWLKEVLKNLIAADPLTKVIWSVFENVTRRRLKHQKILCAGIYRSDYMIHANANHDLELKQIEINTIACAGAAHGQRVAAMHRHFRDIGLYGDVVEQCGATDETKEELNLPTCDNIQGIVNTLEVAHRRYQQEYQISTLDAHCKTCVLMIVQPHNFNITDERPVEYGLRARKPSVACFRLEWGQDVLEHTTLTADNKLLYHPAHLAYSYEVSVVYFRAGFEPREYDGLLKDIGVQIKTRLELSNAAKCPDILTHLTTSKMVQESLCQPGTLERFLDSEVCQRLRRTFMPMYPLDETPLGMEGRRLVRQTDTAMGFVLKPSRDGGGHNVYRENIPGFLAKIPEEDWNQFVLMKMTEPIVGTNSLVSVRGVWRGDVLAELGIWGGAVWQMTGTEHEVLLNQQFGWSVRSKVPDVDEMSVVKGYGCFDSVALIDTTKGQPV